MTVIIQTDSKANLRGSLYMSLAMFGFASNDIVMKSLGSELNLGQIVFIRGLVATMIVAMICLWFGQMRPLSVALSMPVLVRSLAEVVATFLFLKALFVIPIADVSAIMQLLPLAITLGAAYFFGEKIGWRRISAIVVGFLSVLLIIKPGFGGLSIFSIYVLGAVAACMVRDLLTRRLSAEIPSAFVTLVTAVAVCVVFGGLSAVEGWHPVTQTHLLTIVLCSAFLIVGYYFAVTSMRVGDIGFVSPFRYLVLVFSIAGGVIFYDEVPDVYSMIGSAMIVGAGIYTLYREQVTGRRANTTPPVRS